MKFIFSYQGGFAGLKYQFSSDSDTMDTPYKKMIESMAGFDSSRLKKSNPLAKDLFKYQFDFNEGGKTVSLIFSDDNIPAGFESLISYLREKATLT